MTDHIEARKDAAMNLMSSIDVMVSDREKFLRHPAAKAPFNRAVRSNEIRILKKFQATLVREAESAERDRKEAEECLARAADDGFRPGK